MEDQQKRRGTRIVIIVSIVVVALMLLYTQSLKRDLAAVTKQKENYSAQIDRLKKVDQTKAAELNNEFINKFFTYRNTKQRYKDIEPLMTEKGYQSTYPSGSSIPKKGSDVSSSISGLQSYEYQSDKKEVSFMNEFTARTSYNGTASEQKIVIKTQLIALDNGEWKVDNVEFIANVGGQQAQD
ncbi:hypothetical protein ABEX69_09290 [Bacillus safensis]|nr:hypothetical protein [Bacillus safensis]TFV07509.1 hypothetical protein E4T85_17285 [Bacillus stratosphericus]MCY7565745.1 hypothetical protein [Bacillus safensis]MCY7626345.1 hypothetical protein [Bacillus safensis]MCY7634618.1 hypothetical protein [Bacillus safensis]MCY7649411.1 hypothetical protein [Bacillus safensis]